MDRNSIKRLIIENISEKNIDHINEIFSSINWKILSDYEKLVYLYIFDELIHQWNIQIINHSFYVRK